VPLHREVYCAGIQEHQHSAHFRSSANRCLLANTDGALLVTPHLVIAGGPFTAAAQGAKPIAVIDFLQAARLRPLHQASSATAFAGLMIERVTAILDLFSSR
jgi:hypothetical protein